DRTDPKKGYMANVFTAENDEYITGAGFYTTDNNASYEISVCTTAGELETSQALTLRKSRLQASSSEQRRWASS
ncbi:MAG: hypothetical protein IKN34_09830, partial [Treponema sp.]|nr:hypothetical protein [Treponema sp.]